MSGIDGSPSNVRSCPFTFTLTIISSDGGFFRSRITDSQSVTLPVIGDRSMRAAICGDCDPAFYLLRCNKNSGIVKHANPSPKISKANSKLAERQMVTSDNRFAERAMPSRE
jgi:hypothetical protein